MNSMTKGIMIALALSALAACNNELSDRQRKEVAEIARQEADSAILNEESNRAAADANAALAGH